MRFSAKKIGSKLGVLFAEHPHLAKDSVKDIASFIVKSGKTSKLSELIRHFTASYNKKSNTLDLSVTATSKENIPEIKHVGEMKVSMKEIIDPTILGGIKIQGEDFLIDGSVRGKLNKLKTVGVR